MGSGSRTAGAWMQALWLLAGALLTGWVGLSANGYLVPAAICLLLALLVWLGKARGLVRGVAAINLFSGVLLVLVLAFGGFLGDRKLDVSGVSLLANLATGGPFVALAAPLMLLGLRRGREAAA